MAVLKSYIDTPDSPLSIHLDWNGSYFGSVFSYAVSNYYIDSVQVKLGYRLKQDDTSGVHTNINCYWREYFVGDDPVIPGSDADGSNVDTATPVSTSTLTTYGYYETPTGDWVTFSFGGDYECTASKAYCFVLTLDTPTVADPIVPYNALPIISASNGGGTGTVLALKNKTDSPGVWVSYNTRWMVYKVNGTELKYTPPRPTYYNETDDEYYYLDINEGVEGDHPIDGGSEGDDYTVVSRLGNFIRTKKRLVAAGSDKLYYEDTN